MIIQHVKLLTHIHVPCHTPEMSRDGYQWADSAAARMMAAALSHAKAERGLSVRQLGKQLGYKQAVVLSHMANGKTPIPIDRAEDLASTLSIDKKSFLRAVLEQRHPEVDWSLLTASKSHEAKDELANQLEAILDASLGQLNAEQRRIMREVAADSIPTRRWLSVHEIPDYLKFRASRLADQEVQEILEEIEQEGK